MIVYPALFNPQAQSVINKSEKRYFVELMIFGLTPGFLVGVCLIYQNVVYIAPMEGMDKGQQAQDCPWGHNSHVTGAPSL